jgi:cytochrome c peroxidase
MKSLVLIAACLFNISAVQADEADAKNGQALHDENCVACHTSMNAGNASLIYTRTDHKSTDLNKLSNQVQNCNINLGLNWFDTEVNDVTAYLNETYYKYDKITK